MTTTTYDSSSTSAPKSSLNGGRIATRQLLGILRLEVGKNLFSPRAIAVYVLALVPVLLTLVFAIFSDVDDLAPGPVEMIGAFGALFPLYVRVSIFLGTLFLFMNLFRAEVLERTLHYYFLAPVRREVLVLGKYLSALIAASAVFAFGTAAIFLFMIAPYGFSALGEYIFGGPGLRNLMGYIGVAILGCAGYGSIFLLIGQFFRNPVIPAIALWGWELVNFVLPPMLKKISVVHYLQSLYPVPVTEGPLAVIANPTPWWISLPGLILLTIVVIGIATWRAGRMEIHYGDD
ncbi:MAG: hypothetical protein AAGD38_08255 [Acidobacteriota bacterium]